MLLCPIMSIAFYIFLRQVLTWTKYWQTENDLWHTGLVDKLEKANDANTLAILKGGLTEREIKKKQLHKVFKDSFDGKPVFSEKFLFQKSNYIHYNPVSGKCPSDWLSSGRGNLQKIFFLMNIAAHHFMKMEFQDISRQSIIKIYRLTLHYFSFTHA